jgi:hypothetical protein
MVYYVAKLPNIESIMNIRYLIAPTPANETSVWLAFTVTNNSLTGYFHELPKNPDLARFSRRLEYCIETTMTETKYQFEYVYRDDMQHHKAHFKNDGERKENDFHVNHIHMRYSHQVELDTVKNFLDHLKKCEIRTMYRPVNMTFLSDEVCADIIKSCENYENEKSVNGFLETSNDPYYLSLYHRGDNMPNIAEHDTCLKNKNLPCHPDNSKAPSRYSAMPVLNNTLNVAGDVTPVMPEISSAVMLAMTVGMFGLRKLFSDKNKSSVVNAIEEDKSSKLGGRKIS